MLLEEEQFIENLLHQMTLDEKIGQLNQLFSGDELDPEMVRQGRIGSLLHGSGAITGQGTLKSVGAETTNRLQQMALEARMKIPLLLGQDVIHGYCTIFPIPLAQAAAFDPALAEDAASVAAREATADGIKWTFAPMVDIARDPRWGRVAEGSGEDPYLGSQMAASLVKGYQGTDMSAPERLVACAKHYVGYGSAEGGRDYENGEISEPTLRDIYLPPFEAAVHAGAGTLMSAFIDLNGIPATANRRLLTDVLRGEWGFDGFVVSDSGSVTELIQHGVAEDAASAAALALHAGVDMDMVSQAYSNTLAATLQEGQISLQEVDGAVRRILRIKKRAGLFENPFTDPKRFSQEVLTPSSRELAHRLACEAMVLLKNPNGILPLIGFKRILVAGNYVDARRELFGTWTLNGREEDTLSVREGLKETAPKDVELWFAEDSAKATDMAQNADVVVLLMGELPSRSGENANITDLSLPPGQAEFVEAVAGQGKPVVLVVFAGRPLVLSRQASQVDALLFAWHPGIEGSTALGDILFGLESPSGRLPITFPRRTGQVPFYYNHKSSGRPLAPGTWFKSRYLDTPTTPLYPFGHGLTYTTFSYENLQMSSHTLRGEIKVSAQVTNTGSRPGVEVVQLYVRDLVGSLTRPVRELKGFQRISIQPGETRSVVFTFSEDNLAFTRADGSRGVEPGRYHAWIAPDSAGGLMGEFSI